MTTINTQPTNHGLGFALTEIIYICGGYLHLETPKSVQGAVNRLSCFDPRVDHQPFPDESVTICQKESAIKRKRTLFVLMHYCKAIGIKSAVPPEMQNHMQNDEIA